MIKESKKAEKEYEAMQYRLSELELIIETTMGKAMNMDGSMAKSGKRGGKKGSASTKK